MSCSQTLRALVNERLAAAAEEIFVLFERAIAEYEEELCRFKEENQKKQPVLSPRMEFIRGTVQIPSASPGLNQEITETLQIKEEPEEQSVKQEEEQLPVPVPGSSVVFVKDEVSSLLQQRQTEHREETQGEDISSEPHFHSETEGHTEHSSDTDNDDDWDAQCSSAAQMETEAYGDHDNQIQIRDGSTKLSPQNKSAPETTVHSGNVTRADRGAERKKHQCPFCQKIFGTRQTLHTHIRVHTGERPYSCSIWLKRSPPGSSLNQDITETPWTKEKPEKPSVKQEDELLPGPVPESSAVFVTTEESSLLQQRQTEHREETQGEDISSEPHFHSEIEGHNDSSDIDNDDDWERFTQMETEADGDPDNQVQIRDRSTKLSPQNKSAAETTVHSGHMSGADGEAERKKHQCHVCGKRFERKQALQTHIRVHTGERPYSCPICTKAFNQKGHLNIHTRIHTGEKPYSCTVCDEHFADYSVFKRHRLMHTGERPYSCLVCETTFARKSSLDLHARTHTGERPYSCTICGKTFARKDHLNTHMSTHRI